MGMLYLHLFILSQNCLIEQCEIPFHSLFLDQNKTKDLKVKIPDWTFQ